MTSDPRAFELQPTLTGERLELRPLLPGDFEALYAAASDPLIWAVHPEPDRHERAVFQGFFDGAIRSKSAFAVCDRRSGRLVGSSRYYDLDPEKSEVAIGFTFLTREYWGGSYNRELKTLMLDHAFRFVKTAVFHVGENNVRSRKAMAKIGGGLSGTRVKAGRDGLPRVDVIFRIARP
jgi:RimJ/RimL family protein N-acetyltransferase